MPRRAPSDVEELEDEELEENEKPEQSGPQGPSLWQHYDLGVVIFALAIFAGGVFAHRTLTRPTILSFQQGQLTFQRPSGWLPGQRPEAAPAALADSRAGFGEQPAPAPVESDDFHVIYTSPRDARLRLEVRIGAPPTYKNLSGALSVARMAQYGEFYWVRRSVELSIAKRDWIRTEFRYAFKASKAGSPQIAEAVEYATMNDDKLYIVVVHGDPENMKEVDALLRQSLRVQVAKVGQP